MANQDTWDEVGRNFVVPHDSPPRWLLVLTAYVDESGQEQGNWMFVAGYVGNDEQWQRVGSEWRSAIANRQHLHLKELRWGLKKEHDREMLKRAGAVPKSCGLTPILGGVRLSDYDDLIDGTREEKLLNGYICCCFAMVIQTLRGIPKDERLTIIFERQDLYWWMADIAMQVIANERSLPEMLTPDGKTPKLAAWKVVPKGSTVLTEPSDYFAYALLQNWRDKTSLKAEWCRPILEAHNYEGLGAIMKRDKIRETIQHGQMLNLFANALRMARKMYGK